MGSVLFSSLFAGKFMQEPSSKSQTRLYLNAEKMENADDSITSRSPCLNLINSILQKKHFKNCR